MTENEKWAAYDLAKLGLSLIISHFSELVCDEHRRSTPDLRKIQKWEAEQNAFLDKRDALSFEDQASIERLNQELEPLVKKILNPAIRRSGTFTTSADLRSAQP